jgi:hypothetical protein
LDVALYFPYISLPQTAWFTHVFLYWDGLASVVPRQLFTDDPELTIFMRDLIKAGVIRQVRPDLAMLDRRNFEAGFLALLDASGLAESAQRRSWTRLNWEKASADVFDEIRARGLARRDGTRWWVVEERAAGLYMTYLVGCICREEPDLVPVTDVEDRLAQLARPAVGSKAVLDELVYATIQDVLPIPAVRVPFQDLRRFKDDHAEQLRSLRIHLTGKLAELVLIHDQVVRAAKLAEVQREIAESVTRLEEALNKRRWPLMLGGAAALASPALGAGATVVTGGVALAVGLGLATAVTGLGAAAAALRFAPRVDFKSPVAYAALAGRLRPS